MGNLRNLRRRPAAPAKGRGRLQRQIVRAFMVHGSPLSVSVILDWCYARRRSGLGSGHYWSVRRVLRQRADRVNRATTRGRPWLWRLREPE
jgi:hypothetical protein